jgi:lycopene cyclase domain-containing protein
MNKYYYLLTILVFCGIPLTLMWLLYKKELLTYSKVIGTVVLIGAYFALFDYFALRWGAWTYSAKNTLNITLITEIETYLFSAAVFACVASATIISAKMVDDMQSSKQTKQKPKSIDKI